MMAVEEMIAVAVAPPDEAAVAADEVRELLQRIESEGEPLGGVLIDDLAERFVVDEGDRCRSLLF